MIANLRLRLDENALGREDQQLQSVADLYAVLHVAAATSSTQEIDFVLTWPGGEILFGRVDLDRDEHGVVAQVVELFSRLERAPEFRTLLEVAQLARSRLALALVQKRLAAARARAAALSRRLREPPRAKARGGSADTPERKPLSKTKTS